jgi:hypothetical protein
MLFLLLACRDLPVDTSLSTDTDTGCTRSVQVWSDQDGDGWGTGEPVDVCFQEEGQALQSGDCDDDDPDSFPGAPEVPLDAVDQDCDGVDSRDGDGDGEDVDTDCDDADQARSTLFDEICDTGVDENCDGVVDEDCQYFGGIASTEPVFRIEGKRTSEWANLSRTGYKVYYAGAPTDTGQALFGVWGETYSGETVHLFSADQFVGGAVLDLDDAYISLSSYDEFYDTVDLLWWEYGDVRGLFAESTAATWFFEDGEGSLNTDYATNPQGVYSTNSATGPLRLRESSNYPSSLSRHSKAVQAFDLGEETRVDALYWSVDFERPDSPIWVVSDDWTGDGFDDVIIATTNDYLSPYDSGGAVYYEPGPIDDGAFLASDLSQISSWVGDLGPEIAPARYAGEEKFTEDINGDGYPDLIMVQNSSDLDVIYVWYSLTDLDLSAPDLLLFTNETKAFGDMNGDGNLDLATGGKTTVDLLLGPLGTGVVDVAEEAQGHLVVSEDEVMWSDVVFIDDIDGDGCDELLVGDPNYQTEPDLFGPGAAFLYLGAVGSP